MSRRPPDSPPPIIPSGPVAGDYSYQYKPLGAGWHWLCQCFRRKRVEPGALHTGEAIAALSAAFRLVPRDLFEYQP